MRSMGKKLSQNFRNKKATLKADSYLYHYMIAGDLVYLCITEEADVTQRYSNV